MRHVAVGLGTCLLLSGCVWPNLRNGGGAQPPGRSNAPVPSAEALVTYLNDNARRVQSVECRELDLDCRQGLQSVGLRGWMVCQKPRNFRMGANIVGKQAVDLGSNQHEFWYWISKAEPPYQFYCSYDDLARGVTMPFPFQPDWIMEAMGMQEYGPPENFQVVPQPTTVQLVENALSPQGQRVRKITVFHRGNVQGSAPQVTAHILQEANGREICAAYTAEVQHDPTTGAILPRRIRLVWPDQKIELKMKLDDVTVNSPLDAQRVARLFTRPNLANVESYNLARGLDNPRGHVQRTGGLMR